MGTDVERVENGGNVPPMEMCCVFTTADDEAVREKLKKLTVVRKCDDSFYEKESVEEYKKANPEEWFCHLERTLMQCPDCGAYFLCQTKGSDRTYGGTMWIQVSGEADALAISKKLSIWDMWIPPRESLESVKNPYISCLSWFYEPDMENPIELKHEVKCCLFARVENGEWVDRRDFEWVEDYDGEKDLSTTSTVQRRPPLFFAYDDGCRELVKCKKCGALFLHVHSESWYNFDWGAHCSDDYDEYYPVDNREEALVYNERYNVWELMHRYKGPYIQDGWGMKVITQSRFGRLDFYRSPGDLIRSIKAW